MTFARTAAAVFLVCFAIGLLGTFAMSSDDAAREERRTRPCSGYLDTPIRNVPLRCFPIKP